MKNHTYYVQLSRLKFLYNFHSTMINFPLHTAVTEDQIETILNLIKRGFDVNARNGCGKTPLYLAVESQNYKISKLLLDCGADAKDSSLRMAINSRNINILKLFFEAIGDVKAKDYNGYPLLHLAVECGNSHIVKLLTNDGADVNEVNKKNLCNMPLHLAIEKSNNENIVKVLIDAGANVDAKNANKDSPLHLAVETRNFKIVKLLVEAGADVNAKNSNGKSPLYLDKIFSPTIYESIIKLLMKAGTNINEGNHFKEPFFTIFVKSINYNKKGKHIDRIKRILRSVIDHTDVNLKNIDGKNVLANILESGDLSSSSGFVCKIIIEHIAKLKSLNFEVDISLKNIILNTSEITDYFTACTLELEKAKSTKLNESCVMFFDLLVDDELMLTKYAGNQHLIKDFKARGSKFPIYFGAMQSKVYEGIRRRKLYDNAANILRIGLPIFSLTHIRNILDFLNLEDWKNLSV